MAITTLTEAPPPFFSAPMLRDDETVGDGVLLDRFIGGNDAHAFEEIVRRHGGMVLGVCRRVLDNSHDAEDCIQAVFMVLVRKAASVQPRDMVGNWLYGVAYRTALEAKKMAARRRNREKKKSTMPRAESGGDRWQELRPILDHELTRLPDKYRSVLVSCDLEGQTRKEVAQALGVPEGTVASRLARARALLAKRLARRNFAIVPGGLPLLLAEHAAAVVPPRLTASTSDAAADLAGGKAMSDVLSGSAASLADAVIRSMAWAKYSLATGVMIAIAILGIGVVALLPPALADHQHDPAIAHVEQKKDKPRVALDCVLQKIDPANRTVIATLASDSDGGTELHAFHVTATTRIVLEGKERSIDDLRSGMCVNLEWRDGFDGARKAHSIEVVGETFDGVVQALNDTSLTVRVETNGDAIDKTYDFARDDLVLLDGKKAKLKDLKAKMRVTVKTPVGKTKAISVKAAGPKVAAKVKRVDVDKRTLSLDQPDAAFVAEGITVAPEAEVIVAGKRAELNDLKAGMSVTVQMSAETERSLAIRIVAALLHDKAK